MVAQEETFGSFLCHVYNVQVMSRSPLTGRCIFQLVLDPKNTYDNYNKDHWKFLSG